MVRHGEIRKVLEVQQALDVSSPCSNMTQANSWSGGRNRGEVAESKGGVEVVFPFVHYNRRC